MDALRGASALGVALFHAMIPLWIGSEALLHGDAGTSPSLLDRISAVASFPAHYGYVGVVAFFVVSGFAIQYAYRRSDSFDMRSYAARRLLRIVPPYVAAVAVTFLVATYAPLAIPHVTFAPFVKSLFLLQNYPGTGGPFAELSNLQPGGNFSLWSLPVELEFYLTYPLLRLARLRFSAEAVGIGVAAISLGATVVQIFIAAPYADHANWANYVPSSLHYWIIWYAGAYLAERYSAGTMPRWTRRWTLFTAVALTFAAVTRHPFDLPRQVEDFAWTFAVVPIFVRCSGLGIPRSRPLARLEAGLARIGDLSYSLYLIHLPVLYVLGDLWLTQFGTKPTNYLWSVAGVVIALPFAALFRAAIERPSEALGRIVSRRLRPSHAAATAAGAGP